MLYELLDAFLSRVLVVDQGPNKNKALFTSKGFWGLLLNYSRFKGIKALNIANTNSESNNSRDCMEA